MSEISDQHSTDGHDAHPAWLAHHFDSPQQQSASAKLGMWAFLLTEVLFFSGLFCAYAVYRRNFPEIFFDGHHFLDTKMGAINTAVLLLSSFTMAWAVRCAQLGKHVGLIICLCATLVCAFMFLGIKYVEYESKWHHHLVPGQAIIASWFGVEHESEVPGEPPPRGFHPDYQYLADKLEHYDAESGLQRPPEKVYQAQLQARVDNLGPFFGIYFCLTGLHGIHVICGIIAITWLLVRTFKGHFGTGYYDPIDCVGLYWHLVDLIWIYLFPLLYLIH